MIAMVEALAFSGAAAAAGATIYSSVAPQWRRIVRLATGHIEVPFTPLTQLACAERRITSRRWATPTRPMPAQGSMLREAA